VSSFFNTIGNNKKSIFISLLIYVILFVILIYTGINAPKTSEKLEFFFDFSQQNEVTLQQENKQKINKDDLMSDERLNIAVNEALKDNPLSKPYDYYDMPEQSDEYKEQLIKDALQDEYDDYANKEYKVDDSYYAEINKPKVEPSEKNKNNNNYQGATFVSFYLKNRQKRRLIIPTYACEENGKVVVNIIVNKGGLVVKVELNNSYNSAPCLIEAAIDAAKRSTFKRSSNAPDRQSGTISYTFKEQ